MKRRSFLYLIAYGCLGLMPQRQALSRKPGIIEQLWSRNPLDGLFSDLGSAKRIGARYLKSYPHEANRDRLLSSVAEHRSALMLAIRSDYRSGRTLEIEGWQLSLTEARICALAALSCVH